MPAPTLSWTDRGRRATFFGPRTSTVLLVKAYCFVARSCLRAVVRPALLAYGACGDLDRRHLGRIERLLSTDAARCRLSHRRDVQGVGSRHAGRRALRGPQTRIREGW